MMCVCLQMRSVCDCIIFICHSCDVLLFGDMKHMQFVAIFNGFGGAASALVACSEFLKINDGSTFTLIAIALSIALWYNHI